MPFRQSYWRIPIVYFAIGVLFVFGTDYAMQLLGRFLPADMVRVIRISKSLSFIVTTTVVLYFMLRNYARKLHAGQAYYQALYSEAPGAIIMADSMTGHVLEANTSAEKAYGGSAKKLLEKQLEEIFEPHAGQKISSLFDVELGAFKHCGIWEFKNLQKNEYFADIYSSRILIDNQEKLLIGFVNATPVVEAQRVAMSYADQLFEIQEKISDAYIVLDAQYRIKRVNLAFLNMIGVTREYLLGKVLWDLFPNSRDTQFYTHYQDVLTKGVSVYFEDYYPHLDQWYRVSAYPTPDGLVAYLRDITREKKDMARLAESDRNLSAVLENTTDAVWYLNNDLAVVFCNTAYQKIRTDVANITAKEGYSLALATLESGAHLTKALLDAYQSAFAGKQEHITLDVPYKDGHIAILEILINPVKDATGQVVGLGCFARDVSDRVRADKLLRSKTERLRNIAWYQSHEVRGPVASLLGLAKIFNYQDATDPINQEVLQHVRMMAEKLDNAVRSIVQETQDDV